MCVCVLGIGGLSVGRYDPEHTSEFKGRKSAKAAADRLHSAEIKKEADVKAAAALQVWLTRHQ